MCRMEELGLPEQLFQTGFEPSGRKRINNYFNLRWIEVIKEALSDAQQEMLAESQFRQIMLMGAHTFSVMFAHQLLSRQLITRKKYELWWRFAGKPIRYGLPDFAVATGLNCGPPPDSGVGIQAAGKGGKKVKQRVSKGEPKVEFGVLCLGRRTRSHQSGSLDGWSKKKNAKMRTQNSVWHFYCLLKVFYVQPVGVRRYDLTLWRWLVIFRPSSHILGEGSHSC